MTGSTGSQHYVIAPSDACVRVMHSYGTVMGSSTVNRCLCMQVWPKQVNIPFHHSEELEQWQAPLGGHE